MMALMSGILAGDIIHEGLDEGSHHATSGSGRLYH
jgi:hypothetical protein